MATWLRELQKSEKPQISVKFNLQYGQYLEHTVSRQPV